VTTGTTEKLQVKIGGMSCSFCTGSIQKAVGQITGVKTVNVSLSHEEALFQYDPSQVAPDQIKDTLISLGYTVRDPKKVRSFEEEEAIMRKERNRLFVSAAFAGITLLLMIAMWLGIRSPSFKWISMLLALVTVFGTGRQILKIAVASLRRGNGSRERDSYAFGWSL